jgi:hypothetical protein
MILLDLVVEVAAAKIHGLRSIATAMSRTASSVETQLLSVIEGGESKEETENVVESKEDDEILSQSANKPSLSKFKFTESAFSSSTTGSFDPSSQSQWWNANISAEEKKLHRLTPEVIDMEKMQMKKMSSMYRLRQVISFLDSLSSTNARIYSLPFGMLMRAWYEHISLCAFEESSHPVQTSGPPMKKRIYFPCATSITVTFDSRCHLSRGQLILTHGEASKLKTNTYKKDSWPKAPLQIVGDYVDIEFVTNANPDDESVNTSSGADWGWALVALASGALYEATLTEIALPELPEASVSTPQVQSTIGTTSTAKTPVEGEYSSEAKPLVPSAIVTASSAATSANKEHNRMVLVTTLGTKIASGEIRSPHASQFDVIIDRPNVKKTERNIIHVLILKHKKNGN